MKTAMKRKDTCDMKKKKKKEGGEQDVKEKGRNVSSYLIGDIVTWVAKNRRVKVSERK